MLEDLLSSIISRRDMTASEKLVMLVIAKEQGGRSYAKLSRKQIAERCGLSEATVKRAVIDLHSRGLIRCKRSKIAPDYNDLNTYQVIWVNNFNRRRNWLRREQLQACS